MPDDVVNVRSIVPAIGAGASMTAESMTVPLAQASSTAGPLQLRSSGELAGGTMRPVAGIWGRAHAVVCSMAAMVEEENRYGHGFLFVPVAIGLGAVIWFSWPVDPPFPPWIAVFFLCAIISTRLQNSGWRAILIFISLIVVGMALAGIETWRRSTTILDSPVTTDLVGVVERSELGGKGQARYIVDVQETANPQLKRPPGRVSLVVRSQHQPFGNGSVISGRVRLSPPSGPALPDLHDFGFSAYFDGIGAVGYVYGSPQHGTETGPVAGLLDQTSRWIFDLRRSIGDRIRQAAPGDSGAFAAAIVTDERRAISDETVEALRVSGLAHIVAISGLNMALAAGIFFVGLRSLLALFPAVAQAWPVKKFAAGGALAMVTCYYLISGFGVSAQRAYVMMAVMLVAVLLDRPSISLRNVALSALIIMVWTPSEILGPSFQMSFAATAALVAGYALWTRRRQGRQDEPPLFRHPLVTSVESVWNFLAGIVLTSLIGSVATTMFSVEHFHRLAAYGLAANLAAMPVISFVTMSAGLAAMLLMPFGLDGPFIAVMAGSLSWVIAIAHHVAGWGGDIRIGQSHGWFLPLGVVGFLLLTLLRTGLRFSGLLFLAPALMVFWIGPSRPVSSLLVSEDGTMVGLLREKTILINRTRPPEFIYDQWRRARNLTEPIGPALLPDSILATTADRREPLPDTAIAQARLTMKGSGSARFTCATKAWCAMTSVEGILFVVVEDSRYTGAACDVADLVIAPRTRFDACRSGALLLNGATLRKTGAMEIDFAGSRHTGLWRIDTAIEGRSRPWSQHRQYDWRRKIYDPSLPAWLISATAQPAAHASQERDQRRTNSPISQ